MKLAELYARFSYGAVPALLFGGVASLVDYRLGIEVGMIMLYEGMSFK